MGVTTDERWARLQPESITYIIILQKSNSSIHLCSTLYSSSEKIQTLIVPLVVLTRRFKSAYQLREVWGGSESQKENVHWLAPTNNFQKKGGLCS